MAHGWPELLENLYAPCKLALAARHRNTIKKRLVWYRVLNRDPVTSGIENRGFVNQVPTLQLEVAVWQQEFVWIRSAWSCCFEALVAAVSQTVRGVQAIQHTPGPVLQVYKEFLRWGLKHVKGTCLGPKVYKQDLLSCLEYINNTCIWGLQ